MKHLNLSWRKVLSGRIAILTATARRQADVLVAGDDEEMAKAYNLLEGHLLLRAGHLKSSPDNETLSAALGSITNGLNTSAITGSAHPLFDQTVDEITTNLQAVVCTACTSQPACNRDATIITKHGDCIRFFLKCKRLAEEEATAYYTKYLPESLQTRPEVDLSTVYFHNPPNSTPTAKYVCGRTDFPDISGNLSDIQLLLNVPEFDIKSYHAILYILFHEIICHAFQGLGLRTARPNQQRRARETDAFSEGWMDWVTYRIFTDVLQDCGWSDVDVADVVRDFSKDIRAITHQYRNERQDFGRGDPSSRARAFFYIGEEAAQEYHQFLHSLFPLADEADEIFYRISFDWNLDGESPERQDFVNRVRNVLKFKRGSVSELRESLDRYLQSGNIRDLESNS